MFKNLGTVEVIIVSFVLLLVFGGKKLNEIARGLGKTSKEFKKVKKEYDETMAQQEEKEETPNEPVETKKGVA